MGALTVSARWQTVQAEDGGQLSSFSSWGGLPDLTLKPDLAAVGGNVYSTMDGGAYGTMSGHFHGGSPGVWYGGAAATAPARDL